MFEEPTLDEADRDLLNAALAVFRNPAGERVLRYLARVCGAKHTITPGEGQGLVDLPTRLAILEGMRRVYWKVEALLEAAEAMKKEERDRTPDLFSSP